MQTWHQVLCHRRPRRSAQPPSRAELTCRHSVSVRYVVVPHYPLSVLWTSSTLLSLPQTFCTTSISSRVDSLSPCLGWIICCTLLPPLHACGRQVLPRRCSTRSAQPPTWCIGMSWSRQNSWSVECAFILLERQSAVRLRFTYNLVMILTQNNTRTPIKCSWGASTCHTIHLYRVFLLLCRTSFWRLTPWLLFALFRPTSLWHLVCLCPL